MEFRFVPFIIAVVVGVVLVSTMLFPVINSSTATEKTYINEGIPYLTYDGEEHTIVVSYDGAKTTITTDGKLCETPDFSLFPGGASIVYGSDGYIRLNHTGAVRGFSDAFYSANATAGNDVTIVLTSSTATITVGDTVRTMPLAPLAYVAHEGDYSLTTNPCVVDDSIIIAGTTSLTGSYYISFLANGPIDDLTVGNAYSNLPAGVTIADTEAVVNTTTVTTNLVKIDSVVFTATLSDDSTETGTYTYFLAPKEIEYENPQYVGNQTYATLLSIIPLLVVVGLVVGVLGIFARRAEIF